jgi:hypothetical protein
LGPTKGKKNLSNFISGVKKIKKVKTLIKSVNFSFSIFIAQILLHSFFKNNLLDNL